MPFQDCPGAVWIKGQQQFVSTLSVLGSGCISNELPSQSNTCLTGNERKTVWLFFEIFPKAGGATARGSYAGKLRFRIIPNDVFPQVLPGDEGNTPQGNTDYDFALFDVTSFNATHDACAAIKAATSTSSRGSIQKACNYFGYPGATGLSDAGVNYSVDDNRYSLPIPVFVGQVFALAIDNFSLNATGFTLDFDVEAQSNSSGQPSAQVVPQASPIAQTHIQAGSCRNILEVEYSHSLPLSAMQVDNFAYEANGATIHPNAIAPLNAEDVGSTARKFSFVFDEALPFGAGTLVTINNLTDRYGNTAQAGQVPSYLDETVTITGIPFGAVCPKDTIKLDAIAQNSRAAEGFWSFTTPGELIQTGHYARFIPANGFAGQAGLVYSFTTPGGCPDSAIVKFAVSERSDAPSVASSGSLIYSSIPGRSEWMRGDTMICISRYDTLVNPTPGLYRVRSLAGDCPSNWSAPFPVGVTAVRQVNDFSLAIYPNPTHGLLHVDMMSIGSLGHADIDLIAPNGSRLRHYRVNSTTEYASKAIVTDGLASGMYTVRVSASGTLMAQKVFISQ